MVLVSKTDLYQIHIKSPSGLNELLDKLLDVRRLDSDFSPDKAAPCIIYKEFITGIDGSSPRPFERKVIYARTSHSGLQGELSHSVDRSVLSLADSNIDNLNRGKILIAFCEIEMIVDILTCYHLGVYSGKMTYEDVRRDYFAHSKPLSSFEDKKNYLLDNHIIDADIVDELRKVQTIRNEIAHNYFLNHDLNLGRKNIKKLGSVNNVIEARFNYAWLLLMQAYSAVQVDVIKWTYAIKLGLEAK